MNNFLEKILKSYSPSGYETMPSNSTISVFNRELSEKGCDFEFADKIGNSCFSIGSSTPKKKIMLSAHCDEIAMQVQYIDDDGFVHFIKDGGTDPKTLLGAQVEIITANCNVLGVIGKTPIHVEYRTEDKDKVTKISEMKIDCGFENKAEAENFISIGDPIIVKCEPISIGNNRFSCRGLDDKVGVFVVAEVIKRLKDCELKNVKVYGVSCTQEEVGAHGAKSAAKRINPDFSIDYDVTFATDDGYVKKEEFGDIKLGSGAALSHGVDTNYKFGKFIKETAIEKEIPFQEFSIGSGGTDTVHIKNNSFDCDTALISIPNRNMHTQAEVCDFRDLESTIQITVNAILKLDESLEY